MIAVGLMSGTSADGVSLAAIRPGPPLKFLAYRTFPYPRALRERVLGARGLRTPELSELNGDLGRFFAACAKKFIGRGRVDVIGSHGQTVWHEPGRHTLQIGEAAHIAAATGVPTVCDFRPADIAAGGQGAPLTPFFHFHRFAVAHERRAVLNIGGFTNVTYLPDRDPSHVLAYDPGPGNALLDRAARWASGGRERFDRDGARATRGRVMPELVEEWLREPYFARRPPKSTGHELFGEAFFAHARQAVLARGGTADDVFACLARLTVESVARSAEQFFAKPAERWLVCGGGARNPALLGALRARLAPATLDTTDAHGVPSDALEAIAFAVLGHCSSIGQPSNLPAATGATRAVCLGVANPPNGFSASE
jgi:anhydro-N-acetylmuramic acid kinase